MHPLVNIGITAARNAGKIIVQSLEHIDDIKISKKHRNDFVTTVDSLAEEEIINTIRKAYPEHAILGEESGEHEGNQYCWIIDPIDGTTNLIHKLPHFSVSIAVQYKNKIEHAVIYDPIKQDLFVASRGRGASLNDRRIRAGRAQKLSEALLGTGFPYANPEQLETYLQSFAAIFSDCVGIRRCGSAALDLAYVAAGILDGFWESGLKKWDIAAGSLLIQEAGGLIGDFQGTENYFNNGNVVAGNPKIFKAILQKLHSQNNEASR